jgi:hypothetical protein
MKLFILAIVSFLLTAFSLASSQSRIKYETRTYGPFKIGIESPHKIKVRIRSIVRPKKDCLNPTSDLSLVCLDERSKIVYKVDRSNNCEEKSIFSAEEVKLPTEGSALLVMDGELPGDPAEWIDAQFFSYNNQGQFVPITGRLFPYTNEESSDQLPIVKRTIQGIDSLFVQLQDWSGNFYYVNYYPVHLESIVDGNAKAIEQSKYELRIDTNLARKERERVKIDTVTLYDISSKKGNIPIKICIRPNTKITFLDATRSEWDASVQRNPWWLHIIIDGKEGFIPEEDFRAIGLPAYG